MCDSLLKQVTYGVTLAIFDLDGTLIDSFSSWDDAYIEFARRHQVRGFDLRELYAKTDNLLLRDRSGWMKDKYALAQNVDEITREYADIFYCDKFKLENVYENALNVLRRFRDIGITVAICTAGDPRNKRIFDDLGFEPDLYLSCEEIGVPKPDPAIYNAAMHRFGATPAQTVIFEDSMRGLRGARASGARVVTVLCDEKQGDIEERRAAGDVCIAHWGELLDE